MLSVHERQEELWVKPVNLGRRIPEDHLLRRLQKVFMLESVREETARFYGRNGSESVDPAILMKLLILLFWIKWKASGSYC